MIMVFCSVNNAKKKFIVQFQPSLVLGKTIAYYIRVAEDHRSSKDFFANISDGEKKKMLAC